MNKMKRIFSFLLVLSMILGSFGATFTVANAAEVEKADKELTKVPKDVVGTEYEKAISRLVAFGIIEGYPDGTFKPANEVTRAEFAKILIEALGIGNATKAATGVTKFSDVPASHWASGYINVASGQGLIKGYNNGTFQPEKKVSYAEALTMLVRALGYQDNFLKGTWPGNYVAKAAEAGITAGVRFDSAVSSANRGDVAVLVNNTLDGDVVKVETYKDGTVEYKETEVTLLKDKLDISKYEDTRVIADKLVNDGLDTDEITVRFLKDIDKKETKSVRKDYKEGDEKDFRIAKNVNTRKLIGEEVSIYMDSKDKVVYIEVENDDKAYFDYVQEVTKGKDGEIEEISLVRFDKEYNFDRDADVYVYDSKDDQYKKVNVDKDGIRANIKDVLGNVGKFVVKNNKIVYAEIMDSTEANPWMLVRENKKGLLVGVNDTTEDFDIDLTKDGNYDGVLAFDTLGNAINVEDIEKGNLVYVQKHDYDGDDYALVVVVKDNVVEGKLSKVKDDRVTIGDKQLKVVRYKDNGNVFQAFYSVDGYEDIKKWDPKDADWSDDMEDADEENMVAYLDVTGKIAFLSTEAIDGGAGYKYGVVTRAYADNDRVKIYTFAKDKTGEEITYKADKDDNIEEPRKLDELGNPLGKKDVYKNLGGRALEGHVVKFKLNKNGEIAEDEFYVMDPENAWVMEAKKDFGKDTVPSAFKTVNGKKKSFYIDDKAVIIDAESLVYENGKYTFDSDDFSVVNWKDIAEDKNDDTLQYYIFTKRNNDVDIDAIVFFGKDGLSTSSDEEAIYVIDRWSKGGDIYVEYVSYEDGKVAQRQVDKLDKDSSSVSLKDVVKEKPYIAKMKSGNKVELYTKSQKDLSFVSGVVSKRSGNIVELKGNNKEFRLASSVLVYDEDTKKSTSNIRVNDEVIFIVENGVNVRVVSIGDQIKVEDGNDDETKKGNVTLVNKDEGLIEVDGKVLKLDSRVKLINSDNETIAIGPKAVAEKLDKGYDVKVTEKDGIVTEIKLVSTKAELDKEAEKKVVNKELDKVKASYEVPFGTLDVVAEVKKLVEKDVDTAKVTVKVTKNGEKYEVELTSKAADMSDVKAKKEISVKVSEASKDASVKSIIVKNKIAKVDANDNKVYKVELPNGTDLEALTASDIAVEATHAKAKVEEAQGSKETWTVKITAEDTEVSETYTIKITVAK